MICEMRRAGLAHNSVSTYVRVLRTFLNWCQKEGRTNISLQNMKDKETVKETYSDEELVLLLQDGFHPQGLYDDSQGRTGRLFVL